MTGERPIAGEPVTLELAPTLCSNKGNSCWDCPDFNTDPPSDSDCLHFETSAGFPTCTRADGIQRQLERWLRRGTNIDGVDHLARRALTEARHDRRDNPI